MMCMVKQFCVTGQPPLPQGSNHPFHNPALLEQETMNNCNYIQGVEMNKRYQNLVEQCLNTKLSLKQSPPMALEVRGPCTCTRPRSGA
mmetsp:Transcript_28879/g.52795  ORF Transcript_28879/g.52795 Transcript_28879/m.52795 type:complete len:88 (+) Transcript_28879:3-266(+)